MRLPNTGGAFHLHKLYQQPYGIIKKTSHKFFLYNMQVPINYLTVLFAAIASMIIGGLWYGPIFGKKWIALMGWTPEQVEAGKKKGMGKNYALMFLGSLLMSFVLAHSFIFASSYLNMEGAAAGIMVGVWSWIGLIVPVTMSSVLWEGKSWRLWVLNNGYYLVTLSVMGILFAVWQ